MRVSFIIPCWNDLAQLVGALESLVALDPLPEVVVVDASDEPARVREAAARVGARYVGVANPNRGGQLNAGARVATGDIHLQRKNVFSSLVKKRMVGTSAKKDFYGETFAVFNVNDDNPVVKEERKRMGEKARRAA